MHGVRIGIGIALAAVLSGVYWFGFLFLAETWTSFDRTGGAEPNPLVMQAKFVTVLVAGPIGYALLILLWRWGASVLRQR